MTSATIMTMPTTAPIIRLLWCTREARAKKSGSFLEEMVTRGLESTARGKKTVFPLNVYKNVHTHQHSQKCAVSPSCDLWQNSTVCARVARETIGFGTRAGAVKVARRE